MTVGPSGVVWIYKNTGGAGGGARNESWEPQSLVSALWLNSRVTTDESLPFPSKAGWDLLKGSSQLRYSLNSQQRM